MPRLVATDIATELRRRIDAGEWRAEGRIPPERELAGAFNVARNTMRRAVGLLEDSGAVVRQVGRGTFLKAAEGAGFGDVLKRIAGTSPADMMEIRQLLEPAAAAFAAANGSVAELDAVRSAHEAACAASEMPVFEHWDAEFHHLIFACARNEFLKEIHNLMRTLRNQPLWFEMKKRSFSEARRQVYCAEHQAVLDALTSRDPEGARAAMLAHLRTVERNLLGR